MRKPLPTKPRTKPVACTCKGYWFPHRLSSGNPYGVGECSFKKDGTYKYPAPDLPGIDIPGSDEW